MALGRAKDKKSHGSLSTTTTTTESAAATTDSITAGSTNKRSGRTKLRSLGSSENKKRKQSVSKLHYAGEDGYAQLPLTGAAALANKRIAAGRLGAVAQMTQAGAPEWVQLSTPLPT
jgi:hypothetical protein